MDNIDEAVTFAKSLLDNDDLIFPEISRSIKEIEDSHYPENNLFVAMELRLEQAAQNPDNIDQIDYDLLLIFASVCIREHESLPPWLAPFIADVLQGKCERPINRGADKYKNYLRDSKFFRAVHAVAQKFDLPMYTNNNLSNKITAADIVSQAAGYKVDVVTNAYKKFIKWGFQFPNDSGVK